MWCSDTRHQWTESWCATETLIGCPATGLLCYASAHRSDPEVVTLWQNVITRPRCKSVRTVDAAYCYRQSSVVYLSIMIMSHAKSGWTVPDIVWVVDSSGPKEPFFRWGHIGATWQIQLNRACAAWCSFFCQFTLTTCFFSWRCISLKGVGEPGIKVQRSISQMLDQERLRLVGDFSQFISLIWIA